MKINYAQFNLASPANAKAIVSMADLQEWCTSTGRAAYASAVGRLAVLLPGRPLHMIPATEQAMAHILPKATKRVPNPFPGHIKTSDAYKDYRRRVQAAIRAASGHADAKAARAARNDGWHQILSTLQSEVVPGGPVAKVSLTAINRLADGCRKLDLEPWHLEDREALTRLADSALHDNQKSSWTRALRALTRYAEVLPALQELLPPSPIPPLALARRIRSDVPEFLDKQIQVWIEAASHDGIDEITGRPVKPRSVATRNCYRAAFRHYLTTLSQNGHAIAETNDLASLFSGRAMADYLASVAANHDKPGALTPVSATHYVMDLLTVASRNGVDVTDASRISIRDEMLEHGRAKRTEMSESTRQFCQRLLADPERERIFSSQYLLYRERAEEILKECDGDPSRLSWIRRTDLLRFGLMAGFSALTLRGAPDRKGSILQMKLYSQEPHVLPPDRHNKEWRFWLPASITKMRKERPLMPITGKGSDVFGWYVSKIRPLIDAGRNLPWLFPARQADEHLSTQVFDTYMLEVSNAIGLPMTAHKFRSGQATRLLASSWTNLPIAAELLGNTPGVCSRHYAWINQEKLRRDTYAVLDAREKGIRK